MVSVIALIEEKWFLKSYSNSTHIVIEKILVFTSFLNIFSNYFVIWCQMWFISEVKVCKIDSEMCRLIE